MIVLLLTTLTGWLLAMLLRNPILCMISSGGLLRSNYRGEQIPVAAGIMLSLISALVGGAVSGLGLASYRLGMAFSLLIMGFGLLGLVDDVMGSREKSGLKGHLLALVEERILTTGALKAIYGGLLALAVSSMFGGGFWVICLRTVVVALTTNLVNLLDLRPGRAIKGFLTLVTLAGLGAGLVGAGLWQGWYLVSGLVGAVMAYAPYDFRARSMMGDAGSNVLGAGAGFAICLTGMSLGVSWLAAWLIFLVSIHAYAEHYSITKTIEASRILRAIDGMGRGTK